jgi:CheY-like chemotaxis protein
MPKKVLIVEDYADVRTMMKIVVRTYGFDVIEAEDGYEAVEKTQHYHPDLILMDLAMPLMDGITAAKVIKRIKGFEDIPIVALTAYADTYWKEAKDAGCNQVIAKPIKFDNLKPLLNQYLH